MEHITSRNNRWIKYAIQLKQKKWRDREGCFLLEGTRIVEDALNQEIKDCICFVEENSLSLKRINELAERGRLIHWFFLQVNHELMNLISGTEHGQGILLICHKKAHKQEELLKPLQGHYVVLDSVQDPGNMGTILRTATAAGVKGILLTEGCTDLYAEKVVRSSMGGILRIPIYEKISLSFLKEMKEKCGIPFLGTALHQAIPYKSVGPVKDGVFIFGNEGNGICKEILSMTDKNLYIPLSEQVESLNVSIAVAVILFHFI